MAAPSPGSPTDETIFPNASHPGVAVRVFGKLLERVFGEGRAGVGDREEVVLGAGRCSLAVGDFTFERRLGALAGSELDVGRREQLAVRDQPRQVDDVGGGTQVARLDRGPSNGIRWPDRDDVVESAGT